MCVLSTLVLLKSLQKFAFNINLVDRPNHRKIHEGNVPLIGGIAIMGGFMVAALLSPRSLNEWRPLFLSMLPLLIVGVLDDHRDINVRTRIIVQVIACLIMIYYANVRINNLGDLFGMGIVELEGIETVFTVFCVIGVLNALNLIDGIDGACASLSIIAIGGSIFLIKLSTNTESISLMLYFMSGLCAFLIVNLGLLKKQISRVFLGDAGTTTIGFFMCWMFIKFSQNENEIFNPITAVWLLAIPIMDTVTVIISRLCLRKSPFVAGRDHVHHLLLDIGFSPKSVLAILFFLGLLLAVLGVTAEIINIAEPFMFYGFLTVFFIYFLCTKKLRNNIKYNQIK